MTRAKENFILRISTFDNIVDPPTPDDISLISRSLAETDHNEKIRMLRNGMSIIGFTILEDFIKKRTGEILKSIGDTDCNFNSLPDKLRQAVTFFALKGINSRAEVLKRNSEDFVTFIQNETGYIASTKNSTFELSEYSIGWEKSNLNSSDIPDTLGIFNVHGGWNSIQRLSSLINCAILNPDQVFKNCAMNRHNSAHNSDADSLLTDLVSFVQDSKVISFCFDALVSKSLSYIRTRNSDFLTSSIKTRPEDVKIRFVIESGNMWKEFISIDARRAYRSGPDFDLILSGAKNRAMQNKEILLVKYASNDIKNWFDYQ